MYKLALVSALWLATLVVASESAAQEEEPAYDENSSNCISTRRIRRTRVIDDRNILFYFVGGDVYHNILPAACNGLRRENQIRLLHAGRPALRHRCHQRVVRKRLGDA